MRLAVIGTGHMGQKHCRVMANIKQAQLSGVFDVNAEAAVAIAVRHGIRSFQTLDECFQNSDGIIVAVPTAFHYQIAKEAILAGKHVLVEKPFTQHLREAKSLIKLARDHEVMLQVGHVERYNPLFETITAKIPQDVHLIEATRVGYSLRAPDMDVITQFMIHDIDMACALAASKVKRVTAWGTAVTPENKNRKQADIVCATLIFENGVIASLTANRVSRKTERCMKIHGNRSLIIADFLSGELEVATEHGDTLRECVKGALDPLSNELLDFMTAIKTGRRPRVDGSVGMQAMQLASMIQSKVARWLCEK